MSEDLERELLAAIREQSELLAEIRQELAVARAPRSGPITVATAAGILGCSSREVYRQIANGSVRRWPKQVGKTSLVDAASVWKVLDTPAPRAKGPQRSAEAEAEVLAKIRVT